MTLRFLALLVAGAIALTACGGDDAIDDTQPEAGAQTTEAPDTSDDNMSDDEMSDDEMSDDEMSDDEMSDDEMSDDEMSDDEMSTTMMSDDEMSDDEMSDDMTDGDMTDDGMEAMNDLMSVIVGQGDLTVLDELVHAAGLQDTLHDDGPFTVFAPSDAAFAAYGDAMGMTTEELAADVDTLTALLTAHIVDGTDDADMVMGMDGQSFTTLAGTQIDVSVDGDTVTVGGATVVDYDIAADNGVVHIIDMVLAPAG